MVKFLSKYENITVFKSFGAHFENECLPTVNLKPGTLKSSKRSFLISKNVKMI